VQTFSAICTRLNGKTVGTGNLTSAVLVPAKTDVPKSCIANGEIVSSAASTTKFTLTLPNSKYWSKKLMHLGGGDYNGVTPAAPPNVIKRLCLCGERFRSLG
jgi:hypothetical protein